MTQMERLSELLKSSDGQRKYLEWLGDDVTQAFLGAIREMGRPSRPPIVSGSDAAFLTLGESLGYNGAADLMENPVRFGEKVGSPLVASYGAGDPPKDK